MPDQFTGLTAFLKVAETKSFTRAAAELGVAAPSLSEAIRALETRLGVRLFNRTTRSVGLTEAGAEYLERVRPAAEDIRAASAALIEARGRPAGTLRISLPWIALPLIAEPIIGPFSAAFPDIRLDFVFDDRFADLAADGFDAGLRIGELLEKDMIAVPLGGPLRTAVVASPAYLETHGRPKRPADLADHRCIAYRFSSTGRISAWDFVEDGREIAFVPDPVLSANTMPLAVEAAAQGIGLAFVIEALAAPKIKTGELVRVLTPYSATYDPLYLYYPSRRLMPPKLTAFVNFARKQFRRRAA